MPGARPGLESGLENLWELAAHISMGEDVVFITGAGLSVASGIAPYRNSANAIWSNFVVQWCTRERFMADPDQWWNEFWLRTHEKPEFVYARPNAGHEALADIISCSNATIITQNIDALHQRSGIPPSRLVEVHGRLGEYKCVSPTCMNTMVRSAALDNLDDFAVPGTSMEQNNLRVYVPRCPNCGNPLMPQTLLFDEKYQSHGFFGWHQAQFWLRRAAVLVFVGTSFSVGMTSTAIEAARGVKHLFNFNIQPAATSVEFSDRVVAQGLGTVKDILGPSETTLPMLASAVRQMPSLLAGLNALIRHRVGPLIRPRLCLGSGERRTAVRQDIKLNTLKTLYRGFCAEDGRAIDTRRKREESKKRKRRH